MLYKTLPQRLEDVTKIITMSTDHQDSKPKSLHAVNLQLHWNKIGQWPSLNEKSLITSEPSDFNETNRKFSNWCYKQYSLSNYTIKIVQNFIFLATKIYPASGSGYLIHGNWKRGSKQVFLSQCFGSIFILKEWTHNLIFNSDIYRRCAQRWLILNIC